MGRGAVSFAAPETNNAAWPERLRQHLPNEARLHELAERFGLSAFERDVIAVLWTTTYHHEWRAELTASLTEALNANLTPLLISRVFGHTPRARLGSESALLSWQLVAEHPLLDGSAALSLDPHILAWLDGAYELDRELVAYAEKLNPSIELASWGLVALAQQLHAGVAQGQRYCISLRSSEASHGAQGGANEGAHEGARDGVSNGDPYATWAAAAALAQHLGLAALRIHGASDAQRLLRAHRQAFLDTCVPCFATGESARSDARIQDALHSSASAAHTSFHPPGVAPFPLQVVCGQADLALQAGQTTAQQHITVTLPLPTLEERRLLWRQLLPTSQAWNPAAFEDLLWRFDASCGEIARAAAQQPRDAEQAAQCLRDSARVELNSLAQAMPATFTWNDLVLPKDVHERLHDIAFEARERNRLWAHPEAARLWPQGRGVVALIAGPPGTGKTMAAQVIARELGLDLLRVNLAALQSKWVGETAKNLQRVLSSGAHRHAVLFFDEADALYGKRVEDMRDAQDRYVNQDTSQLMLALEACPGVVLLATNLRANIDPAFMRRIRHQVEFPKPDSLARFDIWQRAVTALLGDATFNEQKLTEQKTVLKQGLHALAQFEASAAQIKNAVLSAAFRVRQQPEMHAAPALLELFGAMLLRELNKEGVGVSERDIAALLAAADATNSATDNATKHAALEPAL